MPDTPAIIGRMTIELLDNGTSMPTPRVTFDPVGRLTPNFLDHYQAYIYQEIARAQVAARTGYTPTRSEVEHDADTPPEPATRRQRR